MLLQEKMKNLKFSPSERIVVDFILEKQELIIDYSTTISLMLDIIYSCYFSTNYDKHYEYKIKLSQATEVRKIDNKIIQDE